MEFEPRTYRLFDLGCNKAISIETVDDSDKVRITIEKDYQLGDTISIDLPPEVARAIRDHLNLYLSK